MENGFYFDKAKAEVIDGTLTSCMDSLIAKKNALEEIDFDALGGEQKAKVQEYLKAIISNMDNLIKVIAGENSISTLLKEVGKTYVGQDAEVAQAYSDATSSNAG